MQVGYAIGVCDPVSINIFTYGTGVFDDITLVKMVKELFDFRPYSMIHNLKMLDINYNLLLINIHTVLLLYYNINNTTYLIIQTKNICYPKNGNRYFLFQFISSISILPVRISTY